MKINSLRVLAALFTLSAGMLAASDTAALRVAVPFSFMLSGQSMPAGDYVIEQSLETGMLVVHPVGGHQTFMVLSEPGNAQSFEHPPSLKFERRNGQVYLVGVLTGSAPARTIPSR